MPLGLGGSGIGDWSWRRLEKFVIRVAGRQAALLVLREPMGSKDSVIDAHKPHTKLLSAGFLTLYK